MKKRTLFFAALFCAAGLMAQAPVNDDCSGLIDLGEAPVCPPDTFTNLNATASDIGFDNNPSCFNGNIAEHDVWFQFTCPDTLFDFRISVSGVGVDGLINPEFAIYRGDCEMDGLAELLCAIADIGDSTVFLDVMGLTPGIPYFIRVSDFSVNATPNWGDFVLCVDQIPPSSNIDDGGSSLCEGTLYDSGGPDEDYEAGEDYTFVICPGNTPACITFTMDYYNIENGDFINPGEILSFYDGDNTNSPLLAELNGNGFGQNIGDAGGGVCFQVQATSGCLTIQFQSDADVQFEGFAGHWECSDEPCDPAQNMAVNTMIDPQDIVDAVSTPFTTVTITDINCPSGAYGTFSFPTDQNSLGLEKGLLLTSGDAANAIGPNNQTGATGANNAPGDADLDFLSIQSGNGQESNDACIVEMDVYVTTDELTFEYVFGSEEYPEFVNSSYNDIFAFLVSGPGIVGDPGLGGAENIAVLPGTNTPVQINSVNNLLNWEYYRNTQINDELQYDGHTSDFMGVKKSLTARIDAIPCNTYHLKLAVADRGDFSLDSGVFISEIKGGTPDIAVNFASGIDYFIEDCSGVDDELVISLSQPATDTTYFTVNISGTAIFGVDYILTLPAQIVLLPGQQSVSFPFFPIADNIPEGTETVILELSNDFGCGSVVYKTIVVNIEDNVLVSVNAGADTIFVCAGSTLQLEASGATDYFWAPPSAVSNAFIANPTITPTDNIWLEITGTVGTCVDVDSVFIEIIDPEITVSATADTAICQGTSVPLVATNNVNNSDLVWTPAAGLDDPNSSTPIATPQVSTTYVASVSIAGCLVSDSITILVDTLFFPEFEFLDTTVCQNYPVQLGEIINESTTYEWTPSLGLDDATSAGPFALPDVTTSYTLEATSANGYCSQIETVTVNVIAADVDIEGDEYIEICLGDSLNLNSVFAPTGSDVTWSPAFYVTNATGPSTVAFPDESVTIYANYDVNGCSVTDSVRIRVDSLPNSILARVEDKPIYCPGDTIYLISPTYEPASFPDIIHEWQLFGTMLTPEENWNMVIIASETHIYERITNNHACVDTSTIEVPVAIPPTITVTGTPNGVCPGEEVQLNATVEPNQTLEWMEDPSLSCTMCTNPTANPLGTTTYTVSAPEAECPASGSITIQVIPPPALNLVPNQVLCEGESIQLNDVNQPGVTYTWTSQPAGFSSNEPTPTVTPTGTITYHVLADNGSCTSESEVTIEVASATFSVSEDQTICNGEAAQLSTNITGTQGIVLWDPGALNGENVSVSPSETTTYTATYLFGDDCVLTDMVTVSVLTAPELTLAGDTSICLGGSVLLNNNSETGVTYSWTSEPAGFTASTAMPTVAPDATTTYTVVADNGICQTTGSVTVTVDIATLDAGLDQILCLGESITLEPTITGTPGTLTWQPGNTTGNTLFVDVDTTTTYQLTLVYGDALCVTTDEITVEVIPSVEISDISIIPDTTTLCEGEELSLAVTVNPVNVGLIWTENGEIIPNQTSDSIVIVPTVAPGESATFTVTATTLEGCSATATPVSFEIVRCYFIPNAFTPDGDGVNDTFGLGLQGGNIEIISFEVYNRWGQRVFESTPGNQRWDGKQDGKAAASDVYVYVMKLRFSDGREEVFKGDVTLIR
jgi:gliding motility-associated-like protein